MRALVTGATGFLGKALSMRLQQLGWKVTATGRNRTIGKVLEEQGIMFRPSPLENRKEIIALCQEQDYVFHCGALSSPWGKYAQFYQANVIGTRNVIEGCIESQVKRLIHVSTPSIYFSFQDRLNVKETDPLPNKMVNHYASTKQLAELEVDQAFSQGLETITIRPRALFGPEDQTILPRLLKANEKKMVPLINNGRALIDLTYIENVVDALLLCVDAPKTSLGKKFNITNGEPVYLIEVLEKLFNKLQSPFYGKAISFGSAYRIAALLELLSKTILLGKEPTLTRYTVGVLGVSQTLDISAAKRELGYRPRVSIEEGVDHFVHWWRKQR
ncbi:NAD-dependent epimerase/dehydratase family protein [Risungbinella massiliensis]|uniref:NAD-dependent epimerase/dehydratase family protein n=1 Tax=Risungbinella massiliensis TaxID=1329796 RepID=UPI0005CC6957|nr:NAD-dependent epimerase/dehydratase family protein [Risungbinella massiliensis]